MPLPPPDDLSGPTSSGIPTGWKATGPNPTPPARQLLDAAASSFASQLQPNDLRTVTGQGSCDSTLAVAAQGPCEVPTTEELTAAIPIYSTKLLDSYGLPVPGSPQPGTLSALTQVGNQNGVLSHVVQDSCTVPKQPFLSGLDIPDGSGLTEDTYGLYDVIDPATDRTIPAPGKPDPTVQRKQLKINTTGVTTFINDHNQVDVRDFSRTNSPDLIAELGVKFGGAPPPKDAPTLALLADAGDHLASGVGYPYWFSWTTADPDALISALSPAATVTTDDAHRSVAVTVPAADLTLFPQITGSILWRFCTIDGAIHQINVDTGTGSYTYTDVTTDAALAGAPQPPTNFPLVIETNLATVGGVNVSGLVNNAGDDGNGLLVTDRFGCNTVRDCIADTATGTFTARSAFLETQGIAEGGDTNYFPLQIATDLAFALANSPLGHPFTGEVDDSSYALSYYWFMNAAGKLDIEHYGPYNQYGANAAFQIDADNSNRHETQFGGWIETGANCPLGGKTDGTLFPGNLIHNISTFEGNVFFENATFFSTDLATFSAGISAAGDSGFTGQVTFGPSGPTDTAVTIASSATGQTPLSILDHTNAQVFGIDEAGNATGLSFHATGSSTITNDGRTDHKAMTAPATPASGYTSLYAKTVSSITRLFEKRDDGTEIEIGSGSGGVTTLDGFTGAVTIAAGANIAVTDSSGTITIAATATGSGTQLLVEDGASNPPVTLTLEDGSDWLWADS